MALGKSEKAGVMAAEGSASEQLEGPENAEKGAEDEDEDCQNDSAPLAENGQRQEPDADHRTHEEEEQRHHLP